MQREGIKAVLSAPIGFVSDHLEVLYDLDVEARESALKRGLQWARVPCPNASPAFIRAVHSIVRKSLAPSS
jgi:ferrochelatase